MNKNKTLIDAYFIDVNINKLKQDLLNTGYCKADIEAVVEAINIFIDDMNKSVDIMSSADMTKEPTDEMYMEYGKYMWQKQTERYLKEIEENI